MFAYHEAHFSVVSKLEAKGKGCLQCLHFEILLKAFLCKTAFCLGEKQCMFVKDECSSWAIE